MPPKKKPKVPSRSAADADSPPPDPVASDGWTDEQETTLFKAISVYRLKPAGMHKHFRIIGISELMKNHGVSDSHTNIEGIWRKLQSLYNLEALDEREDLFEDDGSPDPGTDFVLPDDDFGALMTARRVDPDSTDSPMRASTFTFSAAAPRGKKTRIIRSVSADGSRTARTNSLLADDTEDELSMKSSSPAPPRKTKIISTRGRKPGPRGGRGGLKSRLVTSPRRKATAAAAAAAAATTTTTTTKPTPQSKRSRSQESESESEEAASTSSSSSSSSPSPQPERPAKPTTAAAAAAAAATKRAKDRSSDQSDDDDDDDELSDVPDELDDDDDVGTVAETEPGTGEDASDTGDSVTAAESPAPMMSSRGRGLGRGRGSRGRGRGRKRGGDVRRSARRK